MINGKSENCCGCRACSCICPKAAISFNRNKKGFFEPSIDSTKCIQCGICDRVCPLQNKKASVYSQKYYVAKLKDEKLRRKSQSGGIFAALAEQFISNKGIVYGAIISKTLDVVYARATTLREMYPMRGSKYVQADIGNNYLLVKQDLEEGKSVLFSGTPCYVHGLLTFLKESKTNVSKLLTIDLVCHGTPSHKIYKQYLELNERRYQKKINKFVFRDNEHYGSVFVLSNHKQYVTDDYNKCFYSCFALRDCCYSCRYSSIDRVGDISIGDCWGYEKYNPAFDPGNGCSLVIINSEKGYDSFKSIRDRFDYEDTVAGRIMQPNLQHPTAGPANIDSFWKDYEKYGCEYVLRRYCKCDLSHERSVLYSNQRFRGFFHKVRSKCYNSFEH